MGENFRVYNSEKLDQYVYRHRVVVETDHKSLVNISTKPIHNAPKRYNKYYCVYKGTTWLLLTKKGRKCTWWTLYQGHSYTPKILCQAVFEMPWWVICAKWTIVEKLVSHHNSSSCRKLHNSHMGVESCLHVHTAWSWGVFS